VDYVSVLDIESKRIEFACRDLAASVK